MNGSSQLDEADRKPFALCPVCLRKISSYFKFNGEELEYYKTIKDVFKLMNHKDEEAYFKNEIDLFENVIKELTETYKDAQSKKKEKTKVIEFSDKENSDN